MSQKSNSKSTIKVSEQDMFTFYLQKNLWAKGMSYEQFLFVMTESGEVELTDTEQFKRRQRLCFACGKENG